MYKVKYYMNGSNNRISKVFKTLSEAIAFSNKLGVEQLFEIVKVDE